MCKCACCVYTYLCSVCSVCVCVRLLCSLRMCVTIVAQRRCVHVHSTHDWLHVDEVLNVTCSFDKKEIAIDMPAESNK